MHIILILLIPVICRQEVDQKISELQNTLDLRNAQIADLQQQILRLVSSSNVVVCFIFK